MNIHSALDVAKWFLFREQNELVEDECGTISNLKLQKLLYYAQGTFLALKDAPIFKEDIVAWVHGPVVVEVYNKYKEHNGNPIAYDGDLSAQEFSCEEVSILEEVYKEFGQFSAWKLRDMTHNETPWKTTKKNDVIPQNIIKEYFEEYYVE